MSFPTIPTVASGDLLSSTTSPASTTHTFPSLSSLRGGAGPQAGDLLIAIIVQYQGGTANAEFGTWGASFTEMLDDALASGTGNGAIGVARKVATGSESGTFTVTSAHSFKSVQFLLRIPAGTWHGTTVPETAGSTRAAGAVADPASFDPSGWAAEDTLWIAVAGHSETSTTGSPPTLDTPPTDYSGQLIVARVADAVGDITAGVAFRQLNASSEDAGTWSVTNANRGNGIATVIAIRPVLVLSKAQVAWVEFEVPDVAATPKAGTDSGSGADSSAEGVALPRAESATGVDASAELFLAIRTDSGAGVDSSALRQWKAGTLETGIGSDTSSEKSAYPRTESGTGADSIKTKASAATQAGSGADVSAERATYGRVDTSSATDSSRVAVLKLASDSGAGADASSEKSAYTRTDAGTGVETRTEVVAYARVDAGTGSDSSSLSTGSVQKAGADAGSSVDSSSLHASLAKIDIGAGVDTGLLHALLSRVDAGTGAESRILLIKASDSGHGSDASLVRAMLATTDTGTALQIAFLLARLTRVDVGVGSEQVSVFTGVLLPARITATAALSRPVAGVGLNRGGESSTIAGEKEEATITRWP